MPLKHRIILAIAIALVLGALLASPWLVGTGVRAWIFWTAHREKFIVKIEKIDAPFLRPVVLHNFSLISAPNAAYRIEAQASNITVRLNFQHLFLRTRGRLLRHVAIDELHLQIHRNASGSRSSPGTWSTWQQLLPDSANLARFDLRIEDDPVVAIVRGGALLFSEIEPGHFTANEITIASPLVRQTFAPIRAGARWQDLHLTLAGLALARGLDLQSITFDFARLSKQQIGIDFDVDAFGGTIRGDISDDWRNVTPAWTVAGSASNISLAQTAEAIGYADRLTGQLRAGKFIFRGDAGDPENTTASIWAELASPAWRDRKADVLMLGASFYNRKIDIQQLYIKQHANQLTLSGEAPLPNHWRDWLTADYHANVSGAINDLADFASLFGGARDRFKGAMAVAGTIDSHAKKITGAISANGKALKLFGWPVDLFDLKLNFADGIADIAQFNFKRKEDFLRVQGKIDMAGEQGLRGTIEFATKNLADYLPDFSPALPSAGRFDVTGRTATFDGITLGEGAAFVAVDGKANFSDPQKIDISLRASTPLGFREPAADCIDRFEIVPSPKNAPPSARVDAIKMRGSLSSGISEMALQGDAGEKNLRLFCPNETNATLTLTVPPR